MEIEEIKMYIDVEVLVITSDGFRNFGIIQEVTDTTTRMKSPLGRVSIVNVDITLIREKPTIWKRGN